MKNSEYISHKARLQEGWRNRFSGFTMRSPGGFAGIYAS